MNPITTLFLCLALSATCGVALAQQKPLQLEKIVAEQTALRTQLQSGTGALGGLPQAKRNDLLARQQEMLTMLEGKTSARDLTPEQVDYTRSTLDYIAAAQQGNDDNRQVCRSEKTLGSNMAKRVCRSVAQMRLDQERAREALQRVPSN